MGFVLALVEVGGPSLVFLRSMGSGIAGGVASNVGIMCGGGVSLRVCCVERRVRDIILFQLVF